MVNQKFEPDIAHALVEAFVQARHAGTEPPVESLTLDLTPPEYIYETPRLTPGTIIRTSDRAIPVLLRMEQPVLAVLEGVLNDKECNRLIELSRDRLQPSTVVDPETGTNKVAEHRNSFGMFFCAGLNRRIPVQCAGRIPESAGTDTVPFSQRSYVTVRLPPRPGNRFPAAEV